jgi:hypothetical protein
MMMDLYALNFCMENKIFIKLMAFLIIAKDDSGLYSFENIQFHQQRL